MDKSLKQKEQLREYNRMRYAEREFMEKSKLEVSDVIEGWGLNFRMGEVVRHLVQSVSKEDRLKDLQKARFYLEREIHLVEKENGFED